MKYTEQDFAKAEFARHPASGWKATRNGDAKTDEPWSFLYGSTIHRKDDEQMAFEGWEPITVATAESKEPARIDNPLDLKEFASTHGLRYDWHEPDESNINARIIGKHLDNAMGSSTRFEHADWGGEFNVVLTRMDDTDREIQEDLAVVNLATLLSWAAQHGECQR